MASTGRRNEWSFGKRLVLVAIPVWSFLGVGATAHAAMAPTTASLEKATGLARQYQELKSQLEAANQAAEAADPNLRLFRAAQAKMKQWYEDELGPQKREYLKWKEASGKPQEADRIFDQLKQIGGAIVLAREMEDPDAVPLLRDTVLPTLLKQAKDPNAVMGRYVKAGEKDPAKVWAGHKRRAKEEADFARQKLDKLTRQNDIPEIVIQLAEDMARGEGYLMFYSMAIETRTPPQVRDLEKEISAVCRDLAKVLPEWHALMSLADQENKKLLEQVETEIRDGTFSVEKQ